MTGREFMIGFLGCDMAVREFMIGLRGCDMTGREFIIGFLGCGMMGREFMGGRHPHGRIYSICGHLWRHRHRFLGRRG
ncbi:hypothetical protein M9458_023650, partial [Cirrhinus mrigala]